jgi:hypothetical protein
MGAAVNGGIATGAAGGALYGLAGAVTGPGEAVIEPTAILGGATIGGASGLATGLSACKTGGGGGSGGGGGGGKHGTFWKNLKSFRKSIKTDGERLYEWDYTHGDVEVYNSQGKHLGSADPETGQMIKPPVPGRTIDL